jgi:urease accessory protein
MLPASVANSPAAACWAGWAASLCLRFAADDRGTRLVHNRHRGPLRLLKALASGDGRRLEAVIVHPPGGLVGGDTLAIELELGADARVLATTPGQQKWYRSEAVASAHTRIALQADACLEWLPQPAILFDRAHARQALAITLDPTAACVGWEVLVRGRAAMGERLVTGHVDQTLSISVGQRLLWQERLHAGADDRLFDSPLGWGGSRIAASVWCCAPALSADRLRDLRDSWRFLLCRPDPDEQPGDGEAAIRRGAMVGDGSIVRGGATIAADGLLLAKLLADDSEQMMSACQRLWRAARVSLEGDEGTAPRIWRT